jgi:hypothetical protein
MSLAVGEHYFITDSHSQRARDVKGIRTAYCRYAVGYRFF